MVNTLANRLAGSLLLLLIAGCSSSGVPQSTIGARVTWFSYMGGDDVRAKCSETSGDHYRIIYNAVFGEHVRLYEITPAVGGDSWLLETKLLQPLNFSSMQIAFTDPTGLLKAPGQSRLVGGDLIAALAAELDRIGFDEPAPAGIFLRSDDFYWVVAACRGGSFRFNVWPVGSSGFTNQLYDLFDPYDGLEGPLRAPQQNKPLPFMTSDDQRRLEEDGAIVYQVQVGKDGLR